MGVVAIGASCSLQHCHARSEMKAKPAPVQLNSRRKALLSGMIGSVLLITRPAQATGLESITLPQVENPAAKMFDDIKRRNKETLDNAEVSFQSSDLLKTLKERSEAGKEAREKELRDRYCMRQAELGVGDCAGLRLIPGATKSGVQKRPEWMEKIVVGLGGGGGE